ncbi:MAG: Maf family nucleotide pyrophosphatase [Sphaerochaetaceae bacterium]|nr:Maf family nucleotide pyrophosphatase [Spirochaetales bacterium]MDY5498962.1 Maf family nucleotide pyrophosphatase [Sphaerochaetaceae bacterium]
MGSSYREMMPEVILASQSVARKWLLEQEGIKVHVMPTGIDEHSDKRDPGEHVEDLAMQKMGRFLEEHPHPALPVICCDTMIFFEGELIGKAHSVNEARAMLHRFSGRKQIIACGYAFYWNSRIYHGSDIANVRFKVLSDKEIDAYLSTGEWEGAAGAYRIQWKGKSLVESTEGSEATMLGLPQEKIFAIIGSDCAR